jgi:PP-loop superfamily ATP-utilizing enzyme
VRATGFRFVTIDLAGYVRGSSNPIAMSGALDDDEVS